MSVGKQIAVVALIVIQVGASVFMPFSHQHVLFGCSGARQNLQSHDCGANEIHKPLDDCCHCLLCLRDSSSIAVLIFSSMVPRTFAQPLAERTTSVTTRNSEWFSEPDRGPPILLA
jgi:hypothetical protein